MLKKVLSPLWGFKTIQNHLDQVVLTKFKVISRSIILVLDATYLEEKKAKDRALVGKEWLTKEIVKHQPKAGQPPSLRLDPLKGVLFPSTTKNYSTMTL